MHTHSLSDFDSARNPAPQPGSLADLVDLAHGRFVVEPFNPLSRLRYASLWPADFADIFQPVIGSLFCGVSD